MRQSPSVLILIRHGQSTWNKEDRFTGLVDVPLSPQGVEECKCAARMIRRYRLHIAFTSMLKRAYESLSIILNELSVHLITVHAAALNERCYGVLQGLNKNIVQKRYGKEQMELWRRSFKVRPPGGESLADTYDRVVPFFTSHVLPELRQNRNVLVVAHGNSLRALCAHLENIKENDIPQLEIGYALPIIYILEQSGVFKKQI